MAKKKTKRKLNKKDRRRKEDKGRADLHLSFSRKRAFWLATLLFPIALLAILELSLWIASFGDNLRLAHRIEENGRVWLEINQNVGQRYFGLNPEFARQAEFTRIATVKPDNGYRVICLGGSSMAGFPYNKNAAMPGILHTYLQQLFPDRTIEVINLGIAAVNSFAVRDLMPDVLSLEPDAVFVYTGHNEFYGALGVGSSFSLGANRRLVNLYLSLLRFRTFYLIQQTIRKARSLIKGSPEMSASDQPVMQKMARQQVIPYEGKLFQSAEITFAKNLEDVIVMAQDANVPIIIGNLVSNLKDHIPFVSQEPNDLANEQKATWRQAFEAGVRLFEAGNLPAAGEKLRLALEIDSSNAGLSYYLGRCALSNQEVTAAAKFFKAARDLDLLRFRAPSSFNEVIQQACLQNQVPMADIEKAFGELSGDEIIGSELITEHLHPNVRGYGVMAKTLLVELAMAGLLPKQIDRSQIGSLPLEPEKLGITGLDEEIGRQRILALTSEWPFSRRVDLPSSIDPRIEPMVRDIAAQYIQRKLTWEEAHIKLAEEFEKVRAFGDALKEYGAVANFHAEEASLYERIGGCLISLQRYDEAIASFYEAVRLNPSSPFAHAGIGKALMFLSRFSEAEAAFARSIQIDHDKHLFSSRYRSFILYLWGGALTNLRQYGRAEEKLHEALRLDSDNMLAKSFLDTLERKLQNINE
jgi:tetratricopeptide (TPR) repeat protein